MNEQSELSQILSLLNKLDTDIRATNDRLEEKSKEFEAKFEKWDERYFQLVKDQGNTARTIIIAAASVVVLSPVLGAVTDFVTNHLK